MRLTLGLAVVVIATPALAQSPVSQQAPASQQVGERTAPPAANKERTAVGPLVVAESACLQRLQQSIPELRTSLQAVDRRDLRQMRDTAIIFARRGNEEGCRTIAAEMERVAVGTQATAGAQTMGNQTAGADRRTRASAARGLDGQTVSMERLLDTDIVALGGEEVGEVQDIVVIQGPQPRAYAIVDRDGSWFSIGGNLVAVPLGQLRSIEGDEFAVTLSEKAFDELPTVDRGKLNEARSYDGVERHWTAQAR